LESHRSKIIRDELAKLSVIINDQDANGGRHNSHYHHKEGKTRVSLLDADKLLGSTFAWLMHFC
jgi:hypothetical protein